MIKFVTTISLEAGSLEITVTPTNFWGGVKFWFSVMILGYDFHIVWR